MKLLKISALCQEGEARWLSHQVEILLTNSTRKCFGDFRSRSLTLYINQFSDALLNELWDAIDGDLDRGQEQIFPGQPIDLLLNVVGVHLMYKDDDVGAYGTLVKAVRQRLQAGAAVAPRLPGRSGSPAREGDHHTPDHSSARFSDLD